MAGAPEGNTNAARGKRWRDAIEHCVECWPEQPDLENCLPLLRGLRIAARAFVEKMIADNDIAFFKEFGDRIDGKSHQSVDITADVTNRANSLSDDALAEIAANASNNAKT